MPIGEGKGHGMQVHFTMDMRGTNNFLKQLLARITNRLEVIAEKRAREIEDWMRLNAVWNDRTGRARESLTADIMLLQNNTLNIVLFYRDVPYDFYLETMKSGYYSILSPALDTWGPVIMQDVQELVQ